MSTSQALSNSTSSTTLADAGDAASVPAPQSPTSAPPPRPHIASVFAKVALQAGSDTKKPDVESFLGPRFAAEGGATGGALSGGKTGGKALLAAPTGKGAAGALMATAVADAVQFNAFEKCFDALALPPEALALVTTREFNIFDLVDDCPTAAEATLAAAKICHHLFVTSGLPAKFGIEDSVLRRLLFLAMRNYGHRDDVLYHNFFHATDVLQTMHCFLYVANCAALLTDLQQYTLLLACLFHDMQHNGLNNPFHLKLETTAGILTQAVHSASVMEIRHCSATATLLEELPGVFGNVGADERLWMRRSLVSLIMATDMSRHNELFKAFEKTFEAGSSSYDRTNDAHVAQVMDMLLKLCDVSNVSKPFPVARRWGKLVTREFYVQGDVERCLELEPLPHFDRSKRTPTSFPQSQIGFMGFVVQPMYASCAEKLFPGIQWWVDNLVRNAELYEKEKLAPEHDADMTSPRDGQMADAIVSRLHGTVVHSDPLSPPPSETAKAEPTAAPPAALRVKEDEAAAACDDKDASFDDI